MKDEIAKKEIEIRAKKREYKDIVETKLDTLISHSPSPVKLGEQRDQSSKLDKLQQDMKAIKDLLNQDLLKTGGAKKATRFQDMLDEIYMNDSQELNNRQGKENSDDGNNSDRLRGGVDLEIEEATAAQLRSYLEREKLALKKQKSKLDRDKEEYRQDKKRVDELRYSEPARYKQQSTVLEQVKKNMDRNIDLFNDRYAKFLEVEKKLKAK